MRTHPSSILGLVLLLGCADGESPGVARDVVLITLDTTRFDRTSLSDGDASRTPHLARLAAEGLTFERAYAPVPVTLPSHATILTGRSPVVHGLTVNGTRGLDPSLRTVTEALKEAGFDTGAFVSSAVLDARYGLDRGFDTYDAPETGRAERRGRETADRAAKWLRSRPSGKRVFLWLHLYDAHFPYEPPPEFAGRGPYEGEIAAQDAAMGSVLDALRESSRFADALVVVAADHGEGLMDHEEAEHGILLYEEVVRIPLVVRLPGARRAGTRVRSIATLEDIAPTILAQAGLPPLDACDGMDVSDAPEGEAPATDRPAYAESYVGAEIHGFAPIHAWIQGAWKFIDAPEPELYDLASDPGERQNRIDRDGARAAELAAALARRRELWGSERRRGSELSRDPAQRELLAQLGYLASVGREGPSGIDPKRGIRLHNLLRETAALMREGRSRDALDRVRLVLERDPKNRAAALFRARARLQLEDRVNARRELRAFLDRDPDFFEGWMTLGELEEDPARALLCFERAVAIAPDNFEARFNRARATERTGDFLGARARYQEAIEVARLPAALNALSWLLSTSPPPARDPALALELAEEAVRADPDEPEYWDTLAEARAAAGDPAGATAAMDRAIRLSPRPRPDFEERRARFAIMADG